MLTDNAKVIFQKYLSRNPEGEITETILESFERVAYYIAQKDEKPKTFYHELLTAMTNLQLLPNRPAWFGLGRPTGLTSACTVIDIQDDLGREEGSILHSLRDIGMIQQAGGGVGQNWSNLRPKHALVARTGRKSTGPVGFLRAFNVLLQSIQQGGIMMGANNAGMIVSHPDILEFIQLKLDENTLKLYNTNVMITDEFMQAVKSNSEFILKHSGKAYKTIMARSLLREISNAVHKNGGLGIQFYDTAQQGNTTPRLGPLVSTNPCGEYWMRDKESCNLSYLNLPSFWTPSGYNWRGLADAARMGVRMLDNLIEANLYIPEIPSFEKAAKLTRRIGNGITGLADVLILLGAMYGTKKSADIAGQIEEFILWHSMSESVNLAIRRGSFPAIKESIFSPQDFQFKQPQPFIPFIADIGRPELDWSTLINNIKLSGIRNCGFTSIPPASFGTDTMSTEGSGCEPIFAPDYIHHRKNSEDKWWSQDHKSTLINHKMFVAAHQVSPKGHLLVQAALQRFTTEAISKTVNLPQNTTRKEIEDLITLAWKWEIKGLCFYRKGSRKVEVLECKQCQVFAEKD